MFFEFAGDFAKTFLRGHIEYAIDRDQFLVLLQANFVIFQKKFGIMRYAIKLLNDVLLISYVSNRNNQVNISISRKLIARILSWKSKIGNHQYRQMYRQRRSVSLGVNASSLGKENPRSRRSGGETDKFSITAQLIEPTSPARQSATLR